MDATDTSVLSGSNIGAAMAAMLLGLVIVVFAGQLQAETLHAAAHDLRHATGFPCH